MRENKWRAVGNAKHNEGIASESNLWDLSLFCHVMGIYANNKMNKANQKAKQGLLLKYLLFLFLLMQNDYR